MAKEGDGSVIVAWCPNCECYLGAEEIGHACPGDDCNFHLRKRRGYIDQGNDEKRIYWTKRALKEAVDG